jgi:hypothetical protein
MCAALHSRRRSPRGRLPLLLGLAGEWSDLEPQTSSRGKEWWDGAGQGWDRIVGLAPG